MVDGRDLTRPPNISDTVAGITPMDGESLYDWVNRTDQQYQLHVQSINQSIILFCHLSKQAVQADLRVISFTCIHLQ